MIDIVDPRVGTILDGKYRLDTQLAIGGFGVVYRAMHLASNEAVAIKILHAELASDPSIVTRFRREGTMLATLRDPHTISGTEVITSNDGALYIAMELLTGASLFHVLKSGPIPWRRAVDIAIGIACSLREAHAKGIVHRDLKPENIHLEPIDYVKVLDFGIAKTLNAENLTLDGTWIGTLDYMSPEQILATSDIDGRSDLYALGVILYQMIAGVRPMQGATPSEIITAIYQRVPAPLSSHASCPRALDAIVQRLLLRSRDERYATAQELIDALDSLEVGVRRTLPMQTVAPEPPATIVMPAMTDPDDEEGD